MHLVTDDTHARALVSRRWPADAPVAPFLLFPLLHRRELPDESPELLNTPRGLTLNRCTLAPLRVHPFKVVRGVEVRWGNQEHRRRHEQTPDRRRQVLEQTHRVRQQVRANDDNTGENRPVPLGGEGGISDRISGVRSQKRGIEDDKADDDVEEEQGVTHQPRLVERQDVQ